MTSSREVLRLQADLLSRLENTRGPLGTMIEAWATHAYGERPKGEYGRLTRLFHRHLLNSRSYHVESEMVDLTLRRAVDDTRHPGTTSMSQFQPPFAMGFCVFGKPLATVERYGRTERAVAMSWGMVELRDNSDPKSEQAMTGRLVGFWSHHSLAPDDITKEIDGEALRLTGGWSLMHLDFMTYDMRIGPVWLPTLRSSQEQAAVRDLEPVPYTLSTGWITTSLWELMGETLTVVHGEERPDRQTAKVAKRARIGTEVTTITLRREARPTLHPGTGTPLAWRTPVNGHPRTYHRGTEREFTIWIRDHERGPQNAPYRVTKKVYNLKR